MSAPPPPPGLYPGLPEAEPLLVSAPGALARGGMGPSLGQGIIAATLGIAFALLGYLGPHNHPRTAVARWHATVARGDLGTLQRDARLGSRGWIRALIHEKGEADYQRVLRIYARASELGRSEFDRIRSSVEQGGEQAFGSLDYAQQQAVVRQSHDNWVCVRGISGVEGVADLGGCGALYANPPSAELLQRLGTPELSADEQALLAGRTAADPAVAADPTLVGLAQRRAELGQRSLGRLRARVERDGERAFRRLDWSTRHSVDRHSRDRFVRERGFASLSASDRARAGSVDALFEDNSSLPESLGIGLLTPTERAEVSGRSRREFEERRAVYVRETGERLAQTQLITSFGRARYSVEKLYVYGAGGRDLVRRGGARAELEWVQLGDGLNNPASFTMRWSSDDRDWRIGDIAWRARDQRGDDE